MADLNSEHRDEIIARATRQAEWALSTQAIPAGVSRGPGVPSLPGTGQAAVFATGYSGGVTVVPFMLDLSVLDGTDKLAE